MSASPVSLLLAGGGTATFLGLPYPFWQTLNLVCFVALLVWLLRRPLVQFFQTRRHEVAEALRKAEADRAMAEEVARELGERLARIEGDIEALRRNAHEQAEAEEREISARAAEEADRVLSRSRSELDARVRTARNELTAYAADLAVELAKEVVARNATPADEERLVAEGVRSLEEQAR